MSIDNLEKIIAIDMDGTICSINEKYQDCELLEGARESINHIKKKGYKVYIHTGRHILNAQITIEWLINNNIEYDHIVFGKPPAKYYIDDKAIRFDNWKNVLNKIEL